jgi:DNA-binding NarL/FixJ family response regulator
MRTPATRRVMIVDDHELLAHSLEVALGSEGVEVDRITGPTADDILGMATDTKPGLVLLDLDLDEKVGSGVPLIAPLRDRGATVVMVTGSTDEIAMAECIEAGAVGIIRKAATFDQLLGAILRVMNDGTLLSENERQEHLAKLRTTRIENDRRHAPFRALTQRESQVLDELMAGHSADQIARAWTVSTATVRSQIRAVLSKLGVNSQLAATAKARQADWRLPGN